MWVDIEPIFFALYDVKYGGDVNNLFLIKENYF